MENHEGIDYALEVLKVYNRIVAYSDYFRLTKLGVNWTLPKEYIETPFACTTVNLFAWKEEKYYNNYRIWIFIALGDDNEKLKQIFKEQSYNPIWNIFSKLDIEVGMPVVDLTGKNLIYTWIDTHSNSVNSVNSTLAQIMEEAKRQLPELKIYDWKALEEFKQPAKSGCYVATAVYGSYDCPEVWTLRRFRDKSLGETWYGRLFIRFYYAVSPTVVKLFGKQKWFNRFFKKKLDKLVLSLQSKGFENTPYNDKNWR